jgi:chromosome segregation ATPase
VAFFKRKQSKVEKPDSKMTVEKRDIEIENAVYEELLRSVEKSEARDRASEIQSETDTDIEIPTQEPSAPSGLTGLGIGGDYASKFEAPEFKANLSENTEDVDVTPAIRSKAIEDFDATVTNPSPHAGTGRGRADISAMRLDVARISADISSGEELYRRAQSRIENLTQFVERAEVDFSALNRLEPENRRLKARNKTLSAEINDQGRKISVLEADLEDHRQRLAERTQISEQAQARLAQATKSLQEYESVLKKTQMQADQNRLSLERTQISLEVERRETEILREKVADLSETLDARSIETTEAKKMAESLREDCGDFRNQANRFEAENSELRKALDAALKQNNAMKGEMMSLHEDIRNFKTQYEFNVISREDQITALESQIAELNRQVEIKDEIVRNAARDVSELRKLRTSQDLERDRLEKLVDAQNYQLEEAQNALVQARQDASEFDRRYRDVAAALSMNQHRQNNTADNADIAELPDSRFENVSDEDVEQAVTDMAFGVRDNIA